jgi:hypothetical protein
VVEVVDVGVGVGVDTLAAVIEAARSTIARASRRPRLRSGVAVVLADFLCISGKERNVSVRRKVCIPVRAAFVGRVLGEKAESGEEQQKEVVRLRGITGVGAETVEMGCTRDIKSGS